MKKSVLTIFTLLACCIVFPSSAISDPPGGLIWFKTRNPSSGADVACGVAVDSTGIYIVGYAILENGGWRIEKRNPAIGSLVWTKTSNPRSNLV